MLQALRLAYARLFSFSALLTSLLALFVFFLCVTRPMLADPDIWWHLRNAQFLTQNHAFIHFDSYTFTVSGRPWINPEWLSEIPYFYAWKWFGYRGIEVVAIVMIEAVVLGVCYLSWQRVGNIKSALLGCVFFLPLISVSIGPRTLMFGWLCLIVELALLWEFSKGRDWLWALPVVFTVWINSHGSWPLGILFLIIYLAAGLFGGCWGSISVERWLPAQRTRLLRVLGLSSLALMLNPYGWRLLAYPFRITLGHTVTANTVEEWQTLNFHLARGKITYLIIAGVLTLNMIRKRTWALQDLLFTLISILAAFTYTRFLAIAGIVVCPLLAREFSFFHASETKNDKPSLNLALIAIAAATMVTTIPSRSELEQKIAQANPYGAAAYLRSADLHGNLMNEFDWGGYLEWNAPTVLFFIDPRADIFEDGGVLQEYIDATSVKKTFEIVDKYKIHYVLFHKDAPIVYLLLRTPGWVTRYQDETSILLEQKQTAQKTP